VGNFISQQLLIEIIGAVLGLIYLFFSIRKSLWLWPTGLLSSCFYISIFFYSKLYAEMGLQVYYVIVSIYGWYHWIFGQKDNKTKELPVIRLDFKKLTIYFFSFLFFYAILFFILKKYTDSSIPGWDSVATALSIIATWMLAKKVLENWILWIITDALCIGIYIYKDLYPTAILFIVYTILAYVGYLNWKNSKS